MKTTRPERVDMVVCYDVKTNHDDGERRLRRVAKVCEGYGQRVQYSVFECSLTDALYHKMLSRLLEIMDPVEDSLRIYRLPGARGRVVEVYGRDGWVDFQGPLTI
ncbi:MAG TPA: CRISPR-associated endonuclease Cas2 [Fimbriimonadaceae bacterium]|nr:CRISPR-associated endonuclease Cas2 [Fimbriimonadaceae bacterium]HRJ96819.1 CRISPR-associated endonuclease Cas2 [Fimbriimonadaceae bacterium]